MQRTSLKRAAAAITALALCAVGSLALAPPASAALIGATLTAGSKPIIVNTTNQSGGNLTVTLIDPAINGSTVDIRVAPSSGDCITAEEAAAAISFVSASEATANVSVAPADECPGGSVNNVLRLTFDGPVAALTDIPITSIKYNAAESTPKGDVVLKVNAIVVDPADSNATVAQVDRLSGPTRHATAGDIAEEGATGGCSETAVVVNGSNFPDALSAAFLGRPILTVDTDGIPAATKQAIEAMGVKSVTIVGGTGVVSSGVFTTIDGWNETGPAGCDAADGTINVTRIQGANRYATALAVATSAGPGGAGTFDTNVSGACTAEKTVIVASGTNFPDALAAGALASSSSPTRTCGDGRIPLLLTEPGALRPETSEAIATLDPTTVILMGGTGAVADSVRDALDALPGVNQVNRVFGANRQETALDLAEILLDPALGGFKDRFLVATGLNFPDALAGGVFAGRSTGGGLGSVILLSSDTSTLGTANATFIRSYDGTPAPNMLRATILGGTGALSDAVRTAINNAFLARN